MIIHVIKDNNAFRLLYIKYFYLNGELVYINTKFEPHLQGFRIGGIQECAAVKEPLLKPGKRKEEK